MTAIMKYRIAVAWLIGLAPLAATTARGEPAVRIDAIEVGYSNVYRPGHMAPVFVKLTNTQPAPFEGEIRAVQADDDGDRLHWRIDAPLAANSTQWRHILICPSPGALADGDVSISVGSAAGGGYRSVVSMGLSMFDPLYRSLMPIDPEALVDGEWTIGVIGVGVGLFGSLPNHFTTGEPVRVVVVPAERVPSMWQGLDMIDVLYWSNPRAEDLGDDQRKALVQWVWRGGHLILGLGSYAAQLAGRDAALAEIIPVTVKQTGVRVADLTALHRALGGGLGGMPAAVARVVPRHGAYVLARDATDGLPLLCRWAKGCGSVTVMSVTVDDAQLRTTNPSYASALLARLVGLRSGPGSAGLYYSVSVTDKLGSYLDSTAEGGAIVTIVILMCLAYALVAGPGTWLYLRAKGLRHLSWWVFGAVVLVATLAGVLLSLFQIRSEKINAAVVLDLANGSNYGVVQGYFGVYVPEHRSPELEIGTDPEAALLPMIDPAGKTFGGYPDEKDYQLDLADPTHLKVPVRRTIKRLAVSWRGDVGYNVAGWAQVTRRADREAAVADVAGEITNNLPEKLTKTLLIFFCPGPRPLTTVASVGTIEPGQTVRFDSATERRFTVRTLASLHKTLGRNLGLGMPGTNVGSRDFWMQVLMASTLSQYDQPIGHGVQPTANRLCWARLDRFDQIHTGQALLIGEVDAGTFMPVPVRVDGREVDASGSTVVRVLIPVRSPAAGPTAASDRPVTDTEG